jgi:predicted dehydrogenase
MAMQHRRSFLAKAGVAAAGAAALRWATGMAAAGANEKVVVGLIGCGGRGVGVGAGMGGIAYVCDPDRKRLAQAAKRLGVDSSRAVTDFRRVLDDPSVDAVIVATPDHWHAPTAILACNAGKHVYVEKPCSHNYRESQLLVEAARRNRRVVQHGTQSRSNPLIADAVQLLREGLIGDVLAAKAWNVQRRANIGHAEPSDPPPDVDYDLWVGPAEFVPFQSNRFHYNWHWWYNFGTGDVGNDGTHELDYARWGLGVDTLPSNVAGLGGKYFHDDDQQFSDTATVVYEYPGDGKVGDRRQLVFEMRLWTTNHPYNCDSGAEFYGTQGRMILSKRGKLLVFDERERPIENPRPKQPADLKETDHPRDFLDAIQTGRAPAAEIEIGHKSVALVHLGNIAVRLGRSIRFDPDQQQIVGDDEANALLSRRYREGGHWAIPDGA